MPLLPKVELLRMPSRYMIVSIAHDCRKQIGCYSEACALDRSATTEECNLFTNQPKPPSPHSCEFATLLILATPLAAMASPPVAEITTLATIATSQLAVAPVLEIMQTETIIVNRNKIPAQPQADQPQAAEATEEAAASTVERRPAPKAMPGATIRLQPLPAEAPGQLRHMHPLVAPLATWVPQVPADLQQRPPPVDFWTTERGKVALRNALWGVLRHNARDELQLHRQQNHLPRLLKSTPVWAEATTVAAQLVFDRHEPPRMSHILDIIDRTTRNDIDAFLHYWSPQDDVTGQHWFAANPAVP